jgi:hypothetical protein
MDHGRSNIISKYNTPVFQRLEPSFFNIQSEAF